MALDRNNIFFSELTVRDRISKAKIRLNKEFPFFSYMVESLQLIESKNVETIGIDVKGRCYYNPDFIAKLTDEEIVGVLCHEVHHPALRHFQRQGHRTILVNGGSLWNVAIDIADNYLLQQNNLTIPSCGIIPNKTSVDVFGITVQNIDKKSSEEMYEEILAGLEKNGAKRVKPRRGGENSGQQGQEGAGGQSGENEPGTDKKKGKGKGSEKSADQKDDDYTTEHGKAKSFDEHIQLTEDEKADAGKEGKEGAEKEGKGKGKDGDQSADSAGAGDSEGDSPDVDWQKIVAEAFNHAKMIGKAPAGFDRYFEELHSAKVNWRALLRKTIASFIPYDFTYRRPNKKYISQDIYMPTTYGETIRVLCSIDTSGSISQKDLTDYLSEMIGISKTFSNVEFRVLTHDTEVHDNIPIYNGHVNKIKQLKIHGGGGTSHVPLYEYIEKNKRQWNTTLLVSFTDGYSCYPERRPKIETIFVLSGGHCPKEQMPTWGKVVTIE